MARKFTPEEPYYPSLSNGGLERFVTIIFRPAGDGHPGMKVAFYRNAMLNQEEIALIDLRDSIRNRDMYAQRVNDLEKLLADNGVIERQRPKLHTVPRREPDAH